MGINRINFSLEFLGRDILRQLSPEQDGHCKLEKDFFIIENCTQINKIFTAAAIRITANTLLINSADDFITILTPKKLPTMAPIPSGIAAPGITKPIAPEYENAPVPCKI